MKIKKIKKQAFSFNLGIYPISVYVVFCGDWQGLIREMQNRIIEIHGNITQDETSDIVKSVAKIKDSSDSPGQCTQLKNGNVVIRIKNDAYMVNSHMYNVITHETFHATQMIMDHIQMGKLSFETDEAYCYLNGFINEKIFAQI